MPTETIVFGAAVLLAFVVFAAVLVWAERRTHSLGAHFLQGPSGTPAE